MQLTKHLAHEYTSLSTTTNITSITSVQLDTIVAIQRSHGYMYTDTVLISIQLTRRNCKLFPHNHNHDRGWLLQPNSRVISGLSC